MKIEFTPSLKTVDGQSILGTGNIDTGSDNVIAPATNTADYLPQWNGPNSKTLKDGLAVPAGGLAGLTLVGTKQQALTVVSVNTSNYNANIFEFIPVDITLASVVVTLPSAPADGSIIQTKVIGVGNTTALEVKASGIDRFNRAGGETSLYMNKQNEANVFTYQASTGIWYNIVTAGVDNFATNFPGIDAVTPLTAATISINYTSRVLTIVPPLGYFNIFTDGNGKVLRTRITGTVTFPAFTDTSGLWYFYFNAAGTPLVSQIEPSVLTTTSVYELVWNANLFRFTITSATASAGDTYTNNGSTFTVQQSIASGTTLIAARTTGTNNPQASGNLVRATGAGTNPIIFSAFSETLKSVTEILETHENTIPSPSRDWFNAYGVIWQTGFTSVNNVLATGTPNADGRNTVASLTTGTNIDDNLSYTVTNSTGGGLFQQDMGHLTAATLTLNNSGIFPIRYQNAAGNAFTLNGTRFPFDYDFTTNLPNYITSTGVRTPVTTTDFFVYYIYAVADPRTGDAIRSVSDGTQYTTLVNAQASTWARITGLYPLLQHETRPLYKLTFEYRVAYDIAIKKTALREVVDYRKAVVAQATSAGGSLPASSIVFTPAGNIAATNAQVAIEELDNEKVQITLPVTKTADFTVNSENWYINNKVGSTCLVTMPLASAFGGRSITFKNLQAQLMSSVASDVAPIDSATPGTAILLNVVGNWARLVSDGTNWVIMEQAPNNILLLE